MAVRDQLQQVLGEGWGDDRMSPEELLLRRHGISDPAMQKVWRQGSSAQGPAKEIENPPATPLSYSRPQPFHKSPTSLPGGDREDMHQRNAVLQGCIGAMRHFFTRSWHNSTLDQFLTKFTDEVINLALRPLDKVFFVPMVIDPLHGDDDREEWQELLRDASSFVAGVRSALSPEQRAIRLGDALQAYGASDNRGGWAGEREYPTHSVETIADLIFQAGRMELPPYPGVMTLMSKLSPYDPKHLPDLVKSLGGLFTNIGGTLQMRELIDYNDERAFGEVRGAFGRLFHFADNWLRRVPRDLRKMGEAFDADRMSPEEYLLRRHGVKDPAMLKVWKQGSTAQGPAKELDTRIDDEAIFAKEILGKAFFGALTNQRPVSVPRFLRDWNTWLQSGLLQFLQRLPVSVTNVMRYGHILMIDATNETIAATRVFSNPNLRDLTFTDETTFQPMAHNNRYQRPREVADDLWDALQVLKKAVALIQKGHWDQLEQLCRIQADMMTTVRGYFYNIAPGLAPFEGIAEDWVRAQQILPRPALLALAQQESKPGSLLARLQEGWGDERMSPEELLLRRHGVKDPAMIKVWQQGSTATRPEGQRSTQPVEHTWAALQTTIHSLCAAMKKRSSAEFLDVLLNEVTPALEKHIKVKYADSDATAEYSTLLPVIRRQFQTISIDLRQAIDRLTEGDAIAVDTGWEPLRITPSGNLCRTLVDYTNNMTQSPGGSTNSFISALAMTVQTLSWTLQTVPVIDDVLERVNEVVYGLNQVGRALARLNRGASRVSV